MTDVTDETGLEPRVSQEGKKRATEAGGAALPITFFPVGIKVELLINGTWTDISQYVYQRDNIIITGGSSDINSKPSPSSCKFTVNNRDGRFSPLYTAGAYYPYLQRNTQVRVWATVTTVTGNYYSGLRFLGEVRKWPPLSDITGNDVYVQITANGPLRRINEGGGKGSALTRYYSLLKGVYAPIAYWPCEEDPDTTTIGAGIDGGQDMTITSGKPNWKSLFSFNGSAPSGTINNSTWVGLTQSFQFGSGDDLFTDPGNASWTCPPGVTSVDVQCIGGGGGGGQASGGGGGGGGGEWAENTAFTTVPGQQYPLTVGAGGAGGKAGANTLWNNGSIRAHGGSPGSGTSGGAGGTGSAAAVHRNGGAGSSQAASGTQIIKILTTPGTGVWQAPAGVTSVKVECTGAGGGGGNGGGGAAGGGGEYASNNTIAVTPGNLYIYQIGSGGQKGAYDSRGFGQNGTDGGDTKFTGDTTSVTGHGGKGGKNPLAGPIGGAGGTGSSAPTHHDGGTGGIQSPGQFGGGGGGGSAGSGSTGGNGGNGGLTSGGSAGTAGTGATPGAVGGTGGTGDNTVGTDTAGPGHGGGAPGSGGGGGGLYAGSIAHEGAGGIHGQIILTYTPLVTSGGGGGGSAGSAAAGNTATTAAGAVAVAGGGPGGDGSTSGAGNSPQQPPGGGGGGSADNSHQGGNGASGQVEVIYTPTGVPNTNVVRCLLFFPPIRGGNPGKVILRAATTGQVDHFDVMYQSGGSIQVKFFNSGGGTLADSGSIGFNASGVPIMLSVEMTNSGANVNWVVKAIKPGDKVTLGAGASGSIASAAVGNVTTVTVDPNGDVTRTMIGHISVQYALVDLTLVSKAMDGHKSEMGIDRFLRLANEQALDNAPQFREATDHFGFETDLQGWTCNNAVPSRSSSWSSEGGFSLLMTATGEGQPSAFSPQGTAGIACNPGDSMSAAAHLHCDADLTNVYIGLQFWNASGASTGQTNSADQALSAIQSTDPVLAQPIIPSFDVTATVPAGSTTFSVVVGNHHNDAAGTTLYADSVRIQPKMGPQTRKKYHHFLHEIKELDRAIIRETKFLINPYTGLPAPGQGIHMRTKWTLFLQTPAITFDYSLSHLTGQLQPVIDDKLTENHIVVHRHKGSKVVVTLDDGQMSVNEPPAGVGRYKKARRIIAERDEQLLRLANLLLNLGTNNTERYPNIQVNLARTEVSDLVSKIASIEVGDFVQIINLPFWYPSPTAKQLVIGYTETLNAFDWEINWNCTPETPFELSVQQVGWY